MCYVCIQMFVFRHHYQTTCGHKDKNTTILGANPIVSQQVIHEIVETSETHGFRIYTRFMNTIFVC